MSRMAFNLNPQLNLEGFQQRFDIKLYFYKIVLLNLPFNTIKIFLVKCHSLLWEQWKPP